MKYKKIIIIRAIIMIRSKPEYIYDENAAEMSQHSQVANRKASVWNVITRKKKAKTKKKT